ncbi:MAG: DUF1150 domain-containing protein [Hyphomicrobiaceae bacterium]
MSPENKEKAKKARTSKRRSNKVAPDVAREEIRMTSISASELAALGEGRIAYIKVLSSDEARKIYPTIGAVPPGINLYALQSADGRPIALTDSLQAALGHAMGDELEVASVH